MELADGELCPSRHQVENKKTSQFHIVCCQSNQLWEHLDSQCEQHQDRLPRGQLCQVINNLSRLRSKRFEDSPKVLGPTCRWLNLGHLLSNHHRVAFGDLLSAEGLEE